MAITDSPIDDQPPELDYHHAEGFTESALLADQAAVRDAAWREWMLVGIGLTALVAVLAVIIAVAGLAQTGSTQAAAGAAPTKTSTASPATSASSAPTPTLAQARGIAYERFAPVDPTLPAVPAGAVKTFTVSVIQHEVQVSPALAPVEAWTYTVNGVAYRGTAASPPMVVNQGDRVQITFRNGTARDGVNMAHSIDVHAAELSPGLNYLDLAPGQRKVITFTAKYAGVFMYHCATQPVLMHTGAGMTGMFVVKPKNLAPVARELWLVQGEAYIGQPGGLADMTKMQAERPDVIMFNGYANQYKFAPITVPVGQPIRLYVLNAGPSKWSAFHVIGDLFDTVDEEGVVSHGAQTVNLAPAEGATIALTLPAPGNYTFLTHSFGDMVKGAAGVLRTPSAPAVSLAGTATPSGGLTHAVLPPANTMSSSSTQTAAPVVPGALAITLGDMWIHGPQTAKAGKVTFEVTNRGGMPHWFGIVKAPAQLSSGMLTSKPLAQSMQLSIGQSGTVSATLPAGSYELVCLMPGHYAAGQHTAFTVRP